MHNSRRHTAHMLRSRIGLRFSAVSAAGARVERAITRPSTRTSFHCCFFCFSSEAKWFHYTIIYKAARICPRSKPDGSAKLHVNGERILLSNHGHGQGFRYVRKDVFRIFLMPTYMGGNITSSTRLTSEMLSHT